MSGSQPEHSTAEGIEWHPYRTYPHPLPAHQSGQVFVWIQAVFNGRLDQAEHDCTAGGSLRGISEQEVLPVNDEGLDAALDPAVAQLHSAVLKVAGQIRPLLLQVMQRLSLGGLRCDVSGVCPCKHSV